MNAAAFGRHLLDQVGTSPLVEEMPRC